jgi:hypothetical protein
MMNLYYVLILLLILIIGYYSIKYIFFVLVGMVLAFFLAYKYLFPIMKTMY